MGLAVLHTVRPTLSNIKGIIGGDYAKLDFLKKLKIKSFGWG